VKLVSKEIIYKGHKIQKVYTIIGTHDSGYHYEFSLKEAKQYINKKQKLCKFCGTDNNDSANRTNCFNCGKRLFKLIPWKKPNQSKGLE